MPRKCITQPVDTSKMTLEKKIKRLLNPNLDNWVDVDSFDPDTKFQLFVGTTGGLVSRNSGEFRVYGVQIISEKGRKRVVYPADASYASMLATPGKKVWIAVTRCDDIWIAYPEANFITINEYRMGHQQYYKPGSDYDGPRTPSKKQLALLYADPHNPNLPPEFKLHWREHGGVWPTRFDYIGRPPGYRPKSGLSAH